MTIKFLSAAGKSVAVIFCLLLLVGHTFASISFMMATRYVNSLAWGIIWVLFGLVVLFNLWVYPILVIKARNNPERLKSGLYVLLAVLWALEMILLPYGAWEYPKFSRFLNGF